MAEPLLNTREAAALIAPEIGDLNPFWMLADKRRLDRCVRAGIFRPRVYRDRGRCFYSRADLLKLIESVKRRHRATATKIDEAPPTHPATLTLADGRVIALSLTEAEKVAEALGVVLGSA